jgi:hypothetical protein
MKQILRVVLLTLTLINLTSHPTSAKDANSFQDPFDSYSHSISWKEETVRLDNFAIFLSKFSDTKGYIGYYSGENSSQRRAKSRVDRAVKVSNEV